MMNNAAGDTTASRQMAANDIAQDNNRVISNTRMQTDDRARISALVDSELDIPEAEQALDRLLVDAELRAVWEQYQLVGDGLRSDELIGEIDARRSAARFAELLAAEPTVLAPRRRQRRPAWQRYALPGVSVAAALMMVTWVAALQFGGQSGAVLQANAASPTSATVSAVASVAPVDQAKLNEYLGAHHQASSASWRDPSMVRAVGLSGVGVVGANR